MCVCVWGGDKQKLAVSLSCNDFFPQRQVVQIFEAILISGGERIN